MKISGIEVKPCPFCNLSDKLSVEKKETAFVNMYKWSISCMRCDVSMGGIMDDCYNIDSFTRDSEDCLKFYDGRLALIKNWNNRYSDGGDRPQMFRVGI